MHAGFETRTMWSGIPSFYLSWMIMGLGISAIHF